MSLTARYEVDELTFVRFFKSSEKSSVQCAEWNHRGHQWEMFYLSPKGRWKSSSMGVALSSAIAMKKTTMDVEEKWSLHLSRMILS